MILDILKTILGAGATVKDVAQVFTPNAEASDRRDADMQRAALDQMAAEFRANDRGWFDRLIDGLNRLPRPLMAFGVIGLFIAAMTSPVWFTQRMTGLQLVPDPLWWLLGAVVSFYFGARHQAKAHDTQKALAQTLARAPQVIRTIEQLDTLRHDSPGAADTGNDAALALDATQPPAENPAVQDWHQAGGAGDR